MIDTDDRDLPALSAEIFELLDGSPENTREANDRFKQITEALEDNLKENPKFEDFVWPGVGRKSGSPYTSRPNQQPGPNGTVEYREHCWLGIAHREYRERYERPQDGVQFQFTVRSNTGTAEPPANMALHLDAGAGSELREDVLSNLQNHRDEFLDQVRELPSKRHALLHSSTLYRDRDGTLVLSLTRILHW
jgi:hypothetical protein